jgi:hypothetical protein
LIDIDRARYSTLPQRDEQENDHQRLGVKHAPSPLEAGAGSYSTVDAIHFLN